MGQHRDSIPGVRPLIRQRAAKRATPALFILLAAAILLAVSIACKPTGGNQPGASGAGGDPGRAAPETSSTPPFQTREPDRYRARMRLTFSLDEHTETSETIIRRDRERRREDYEPVPGVRVSELEIPSGRFLLLPDARLYAEVRPEEGGQEPAPQMGPPEDFAPDLLVNESRTEASYEKLGAEQLNGRAATKYRVVTVGAGLMDQGAGSEQLIWIDEALGMPVRSETVQGAGGGQGAARYTMEMLDISEEVDGSVFALPQDYKRVALKELLDRISPSKQPPAGAEDGRKGAGR